MKHFDCKTSFCFFFNIDECREMLVEGGFALEERNASDGFSELLADTVQSNG